MFISHGEVELRFLGPYERSFFSHTTALHFRALVHWSEVEWRLLRQMTDMRSKGYDALQWSISTWHLGGLGGCFFYDPWWSLLSLLPPFGFRGRSNVSMSLYNRCQLSINNARAGNKEILTFIIKQRFALFLASGSGYLWDHYHHASYIIISITTLFCFFSYSCLPIIAVWLPDITFNFFRLVSVLPPQPNSRIMIGVRYRRIILSLRAMGVLGFMCSCWSSLHLRARELDIMRQINQEYNSMIYIQ